MHRNRTQLALLTGALLLGGCQSAGLRFLNLIGLQGAPLVVGLVANRQPAGTEGPIAALNPFAPYDGLRAALHAELGRPVGLDLCFPLQLAPSLDSGIFHLAVVSPLDYANLAQRERFAVLAATADPQGRSARPAVLVVKADSPITSADELRGKVVAFGRANDARTHQAALDLLAQHGLAKTDLSLELLPIPGSLKHMPNARAVAQTVINLSSDAGFLDEADWEDLPEHATEPDEPARDRLRVIDRTIDVPDLLIIASPKLDPETTEKVRACLLNADQEHPEALSSLRISGYRALDDTLRTLWDRLAQPQPTSRPAEP